LAHPGTGVTFGWSRNYQFMWGETGVLRPGVVFSPSQSLDADLTTRNSVTLQYNRGFAFKDQRRDPQSVGRLVVTQDPSIPSGTAAVGLGVSGSAAFAFQAQPNMSMNLNLERPEYWVTFGTYAKGQLLDRWQITNSARVDFPPGVFRMTATLDGGNNWNVQPGYSSLPAS
jgi:hypothetical protein